MRACLTLAALLLGTQAAAAPLTIRFLNVGQGDAVLIVSPEGKGVLYDGGRSEPRLQALLGQYQVGSLDLVVASHADADHIAGLVPAVTRYKPRLFLNNGLAVPTQTWGKLVAAVEKAGTQGLLAREQVVNLGSVKLTVISPPAGMPRDEQNVNSVGLLVEYGKFRMLMTGDSETAETQGWLKKYPPAFLGPVDVYKSIHHGAANGDSARWLAAVRPRNVIVSVGLNNYGHPTSQALNLYRSVGAKVYRTDLDGTVTVTVQPGGAYTVTTESGRAPTGASAPTPRSIPAVPVSPPPNVSYPNCAAVRAAGAAPLLRGQPGYRAGLDRDGDGRACE